MNPVLVKGVTPPGRPYDLKVPVGTTSTIVAALAARTIVVAAPATHAVARKADVHVVRPRDTVTSIARRYGISVGDVLKWNSLETRDRIRPGDRLRVAELRGDGRAVR
jgi:LysM repeat protein